MTQTAPPRTLVLGAKRTVKGPGMYTITLKPTGDGIRALDAHASIRVKLSITFAPTVGRPVSSTIELTLAR